MVNGISSNINSVQLLRAANAFKAANKPLNKRGVEDIDESSGNNGLLEDENSPPAGKTASTTSIPSMYGMTQEKLDEIKTLAGRVGESELSEDDISYGLRYGRSVLVDYSA